MEKYIYQEHLTLVLANEALITWSSRCMLNKGVLGSKRKKIDTSQENY